MQTHKEVFTGIYANNLWGSDESVSGMGSSISSSANIIDALNLIIDRYSISSIIDIGCGDFNWMKEVNLSGVSYLGLDIVDGLIDSNIEKYSSDNINFMVSDITIDQLSAADLILCRDVLLHYSIEENKKIIKNIVDSGSKFFAINFFTREQVNIDINIGEAHLINLMCDPYNLNNPIESFNEFEGIYPEYSDKVLCLWRTNNE